MKPHPRIRLGHVRVRVRRSRLAEIQLASTSDIAFLLLIFFLSTAVFVSQFGLPLVVPAAGSQPIEVDESEVLVILLAETGEITTEGEPLVHSEISSWARDRERQEPGRIYLLKVEKKCQYSILVGVIDELRSVPIERISFRMTDAQ